MKNGFVIFIIITFYLISCYTTTFAQAYYFKDYMTTDGLVQGTIKTIYQDSKGRMWFGTAEGVSIYDGTEFYNYASKEGFTKSVITSFYEIIPGVMLVGTLGDGIAVFSDPPFLRTTMKTKITEGKYISGSSINQIIPDMKKNIWFCTNNGITIWKISDNKLIAVEQIDSLGGYRTADFYQLEFYDEENFYAATESGILRKTGSFYKLMEFNGRVISGPVFKLYKDSNGIIWFSNFHELYYIENHIVYNASEISQSLKESIYCFGEDKNKTLYFGTINGLIVFNKSTTFSITKENGLESKDIISLYSDSENNLWIGSLSGISKLISSSFKFVWNQSFAGHFTNIVRDGKKLYVTSSEGLFEVKNYKLYKSELGSGIKTRVINHIAKDLNGNFWLSTDNGVYLKNGSTIKHYTEKNGLPHNFIYQIAVDKNNAAWIATQRGLVCINENKIYNFENKPGNNWVYSDDSTRQLLSEQSIRKVVADEENSIWVGSWGSGLFRIKDNIVKHYTQNDGLLDISIRGIQIDAQNNIWVSTRYGGAFKYDGHSFINYGTKNGLKSNWVFSVETDYNQNIWFCTANGLTKHDGYKSVNYNASDGITSAEITASTKFDGKLWFLSNSQIFSYEPEEKKGDFNYPAIYFKQIKLIDGNLPMEDQLKIKADMDINSILNQSKKLPGDIILEHFQNSLVFEFAGIDFRDEKRVTYEYILEGFDKKWTSSSQNNYLTYTHLPPGRYTFKVTAINKEGIKSLVPAVFHFEILVPFWQRWWFISISILLFILLVSLINYIIYQYKIRQALKLERMRTKISTDLHDEIGTSLSSISIFAELIKREETGSSRKTSDMLERIENTSRDLIDKMSDIVWAINPGNDSFEDALLKLKDYTVKILESRGIDVKLNFEPDNDKIVLPMDVRRNLLLIFKEVVTNAAKYSKASVVKINLKFNDKLEKKIFLSVEDDGIGFDTSKSNNGYGLKNIKRRVR